MNPWNCAVWLCIPLLCSRFIAASGHAAETVSVPAAEESAGSEALDSASAPETIETPNPRLLERLRRERPEEFTRLEMLRQRDPEAFRLEWQRRFKKRLETRAEGHPLGHFPPARLWDADSQLSQELLALAERYRATSDPTERNELRRQLRERIEEAFRTRDEAWMARLAAARRELEELERRFDQWRRTRLALIERRIERLLEESPDSTRSPQTP